jgi:chromosome partitioning protein
MQLFIDCNPSFSAYTGLAIIASDHLIVPCTADGSSARAITNIDQLLYGVDVPPSYKNVNFPARAKTYNLSLPTIHVVPLNRSTQYEQKAPKAFADMYEEIKSRKNVCAGNPVRFSALRITIYSWTYRTRIVSVW